MAAARSLSKSGPEEGRAVNASGLRDAGKEEEGVAFAEAVETAGKLEAFAGFTFFGEGHDGFDVSGEELTAVGLQLLDGFFDKGIA
jgi:hypothetical protein